MVPPAYWTRIKGYSNKFLCLAPALNAGPPSATRNRTSSKAR